MRFGLVLHSGQPTSSTPDFDYLEPAAADLLHPDLPDDQWTLPQFPIPIVAVHSLIPPSLPITGPDADVAALRLYVQRACERASRLGVRVITLASPAALRVPEGFDPKQAKSQTLEFFRTAVPFFARYEIMLVAGVNPPGQSNSMTTLPEVLQYVWQIDHPWFQCLLDLSSVQSGATTPDQMNDAMPWVRHVHAPIDMTHLEPALVELKRSKYQDLISIKLQADSTPTEAAPVVQSLKSLWERLSISLHGYSGGSERNGRLPVSG